MGKRLGTLRQLAPRQHDPPAAFPAFQPDIRPQPHNPPLVTSTGMYLAQPHDISNLQIGQHGCIITRGGIIFFRGVFYGFF